MMKLPVYKQSIWKTNRQTHKLAEKNKERSKETKRNYQRKKAKLKETKIFYILIKPQIESSSK